MKMCIIQHLFVLFVATCFFGCSEKINNESNPEKKNTATKILSLENQLIKGSAHQRENAVTELANIGGESAVLLLQKALKDSDAAVRKAAVLALDKMNDKTSVDLLIKMLKDSDIYVRLGVVKALGKIRTQKAILGLIEALKDKKTYVSISASETLVSVGAQIFPVLMDALSNDPVKLRLAILQTLTKMGSEAIPNIIDHFGKSKDDFIGLFLLSALESISEKNTERQSLMALSKGENVKNICNKNQRRMICKFLINVVKDDRRSKMRIKAADLLGKLGDKTIVSELVTFINESDVALRRTVALTLTIIESKVAIPVLIDILESKEKSYGNISEILNLVTGEDFGTDVAKWREWWEKNKDRILKEEAEKERLEKEKTGKESVEK